MSSFKILPYILSIFFMFSFTGHAEFVITDQKLWNPLPNQALIGGMIEQRHPTDLYIYNNDSLPYLLIKSTAPYVFLAGIPSEEHLYKIIETLKKYEKLTLICDESLHAFFITKGFLLQPRVELELTSSVLKPPSFFHGYTIKPLDTMELYKQGTWFNFISSCYGSAELFLTNGFGFALVNEEGAPIAEAYAAFIGKGLCEIGVVTHPDYQGKGFSTVVAHRLIEECQMRGLKAVWSCNCDNIASLKVAFKLGFQVKRYYAFLKK